MSLLFSNVQGFSFHLREMHIYYAFVVLDFCSVIFQIKIYCMELKMKQYLKHLINMSSSDPSSKW